MVQLFAVVIGSLFTAVGLLFVHAGLPRTATLVCDRSPSQQISCHKQETIAGIPTHHQRLEDVQSIQLKSFQVPIGDGDIDAPRHQILLSGSQGTLSFGLTSNAQELQPTLTKLKHFQAAASPNSITIYGGTTAWMQLGLGSLVTFFGFWLVVAPIRVAFKAR